jgi:sugar lactone lactonase YvrE
VTSVDNHLFVLRSPSQQRIEMYDLETFTLQRTLKVTDLCDSYGYNGLTACVISKSLYVSDYYKAAVHKVQLPVESKTSKWSVGVGPRGLSINTACNLLVACFDDKRIQEYNTNSGLMVREICLVSIDGELLRPFHMIQLKDGHFVVSCRHSSSSMDDVVEVDVDGKVVVSYTSRLQSTKKQNLLWPRRLAVAKNDDCILVVDLNNNRIVIWCRSLNCASEFSVMSTDGGLQQPSCLHFIESHGRLFVGELSGQRRVLVFDNVINIANSFQ